MWPYFFILSLFSVLNWIQGRIKGPPGRHCWDRIFKFGVSDTPKYGQHCHTSQISGGFFCLLDLVQMGCANSNSSLAIGATTPTSIQRNWGISKFRQPKHWNWSLELWIDQFFSNDWEYVMKKLYSRIHISFTAPLIAYKRSSKLYWKIFLLICNYNSMRLSLVDD